MKPSNPPDLLSHTARELARALFKQGDQSTPCQRIQFLGGKYPDGEIPHGGLCEGALAHFFDVELRKLLGGFVPQSAIHTRDYFAAAALQGLLASFAGADCRMPTPEALAKDAFQHADALLREREKSLLEGEVGNE